VERALAGMEGVFTQQMRQRVIVLLELLGKEQGNVTATDRPGCLREFPKVHSEAAAEDLL